jgi:hypothetical protein
MSNAIGDAGARFLSWSLRENQTLQKLQLCGNAIRDTGAHAFVESLLSNHTLQELQLQYNPIRDLGLSILSEASKACITCCIITNKRNKLPFEAC